MTSLLTKDGFMRLRNGIKVFPEHDQAIEKLLAELLERCPAHLILLTDCSGMLVSVYGDRTKTDLTAVSALVTGDLAASAEIARITGQYQSNQLVMREGDKAVFFISEAGPYLVLFVQVSSDTPIGWCRLLIREASRQLSQVVATPPKEVSLIDLGLSDEKLGDLFDDALDAVWKG